jgi:hypothetical protein
MATTTITHKIDPETYVLCEKAARADGKKTVEEWLEFIISEKVGNTQFCRKR